jgi:hypothetical protein
LEVTPKTIWPAARMLVIVYPMLSFVPRRYVHLDMSPISEAPDRGRSVNAKQDGSPSA